MFTYNMKLWMGVLVLVVLGAAVAVVASMQDQRLQALEGRVNNLQQNGNSSDVYQLEITDLKAQVDKLNSAQASIPQTGANDLQAKVDNLQAQVNALKTASTPREPAVDLSAVALAQNVLDTAGIHVIAGTLSDKKTIDPAYITTVTRVKKVLLATKWPAPLADQSKSLIASLDSFATALQANNVNDALDAAAKVHSGQHAFSSAIDKYLSSAGNQVQEQPVSPAEVAQAQNVLDTAGFHIMAANLTDKKTIDPAYITTVAQVKKVLTATHWPDQLAGQEKDFVNQLDALAAALQSKNTDQAVTTVGNVHGAQHSFSKAIDAWLSSAPAQ